jgi:hypothetical protein
VSDARPPRDRREAWEAVAGRVGGAFGEAKVTGKYVVTAEHRTWTMTMDLRLVSAGFTNSMHTRVWAPFQGRGELRLTVRRRTFFDALAKRVGLGGGIPADPTLARTHVARGRPAARGRAVLSAGLSSAVVERGSFRVDVRRAPRRVRKTAGDETLMVEVLSLGVDTDVDRMVGMFEVARGALDALSATGVAWPDRD